MIVVNCSKRTFNDTKLQVRYYVQYNILPNIFPNKQLPYTECSEVLESDFEAHPHAKPHTSCLTYFKTL